MAGQTSFTSDLAERICSEMAKGRYLNAICKELQIPESNVRFWAVQNKDGFAAMYARAREAQTEAWADEINDIADSADDATNVQTARLRVDTKKWLMARIAPKRYGDKLGIGAADGLDNLTVRVLPPQTNTTT